MYCKLKKFFKKFLYKLFKQKKNIFFFMMVLMIFRLGCFIPLPGINFSLILKLIKNQHGIFIDMLNMFSGGSLNHASIFTLGIIPYVSSSMIMQLLIALFPFFKKINENSNENKNKIHIYIRYITFFIAIFQSSIIAVALPHMYVIRVFIYNPNIIFYITTVLSLVCGTMFLVWLSEKIIEYDIGNGVSFIIFIGIISNLSFNINNIIESIKNGNISILQLFLINIFTIILIFFIIFFELSQRRIFVNYFNLNQKCSFYLSKVVYLPFKLNISGVISVIFTSVSILFISFVLFKFKNYINFKLFILISFFLKPDNIIYFLLYICGIIFFNFFYTMLILNSNEISNNLKKSGAYIIGVRPGNQTTSYINKIIIKLNLINSFYIILIYFFSVFIINKIKIPFYFSGLSLLIIIVILIDFLNQFNILIISYKYNLILKKKGF